MSVSNPMSKFPTYDSITTMLETNRSEMKMKKLFFIENFFKKNIKFLIEKILKMKVLSNNKIIHKWYVLINVFIAIIHMRKYKIKKLSTSNFSEIFKGKLNKKRIVLKKKIIFLSN